MTGIGRNQHLPPSNKNHNQENGEESEGKNKGEN